MNQLTQVFPLQFLQATLSCAVAGLAVWLLLKAALRAWPALALQRGTWLLAQAAIVAVFLLALSPRSAQISLLPAIEIGKAAPAATPATLVGADGTHGADIDGDDAIGDSTWLASLAQAWLLAYGTGLVYCAGRWMRARRAVRTLAASARELDAAELRGHAAFRGKPVEQLLRRGLRVLETEAAVSPMLLGLRRPSLLLPRHLNTFSTEQQQLVIDHELTHWQRADPWWLHASLALQMLAWFNPVLRGLGQQLSWAQELSCDRQVLAGRPQQLRRDYAAALVTQLKLQQAMPAALGIQLAFGGLPHATLGERIRLIRDNALTPLAGLARLAVPSALFALLGACMLLQPAFAWRADLAPAAGPSAAASAPDLTPGQWRDPMQTARISSFYGVPRKSGTRHDGIDMAAPIGTPILAPAPGKVAESTDLYQGQAKYGKVIVIDHADGLRSMYAHLDQRTVKAGDLVAAGQAIGRSGATGRVTGPHLHLEVTRHGQHIDPQRLIAGLDQRATPYALRARASGRVD